MRKLIAAMLVALTVGCATAEQGTVNEPATATPTVACKDVNAYHEELMGLPIYSGVIIMTPDQLSAIVLAINAAGVPVTATSGRFYPLPLLDAIGILLADGDCVTYDNVVPRDLVESTLGQPI